MEFNKVNVKMRALLKLFFLGVLVESTILYKIVLMRAASRSFLFTPWSCEVINQKRRLKLITCLSLFRFN